MKAAAEMYRKDIQMLKDALGRTSGILGDSTRRLIWKDIADRILTTIVADTYITAAEMEMLLDELFCDIGEEV